MLLDLVTVKFLSVWSTKPSYLFGGSGAVLCIARARCSFVDGVPRRLVNDVYVYRQPSLLVGVFLFTIGFNLILLGLLAELIVGRTTSRSRSRSTSFASAELRGADAALVAGPHVCGICGIVGRDRVDREALVA